MMSSKEQESKYQESHPNLRKLDNSGLLTLFYTERLSSVWGKFTQWWRQRPFSLPSCWLTLLPSVWRFVSQPSWLWIL